MTDHAWRGGAPGHRSVRQLGMALMSRRAGARRFAFAPAVDRLEGRQLLSGDVSVSLAHAVLSVQGTSPSAPIQVDIVAPTSRPVVPGSVIVPGVAQFTGAEVHRIQVVGVVGEAITIVAPPHEARIPVTVSHDGVAAAAPAAPASPTPAGTSTAGGVTDTSASAGTAAASAPPATVPALDQAVVTLINQARAQNGLPPLVVNPELVASAQIQSNNMAQLDELSHTLPGVALPTLQDRAAAVGYDYSYLGENIAYNYPDAPSVVTAWMNSAEHRANILDPDYTDIGVGFAWNSAGAAYATADFGSTQPP